MAFGISQEEKDTLHLIETWTPKSDVWAFRYGGFALVSSTALSAAYINHKFRKALKLRNFAYITTYLATTCIPAVFAPLLHGIFVVSPTITAKPMCPVCLETRSMLIQVGASVSYPLLLAPLACFQFADRYMTAALPPMWPQPQFIIKKYYSIVKPIANKLLILAFINMALGAGIVYAEHRNLETVSRKLEKMERAVTESVTPKRLQELKSDDTSAKIIRSEPKVSFTFD